LLDAFQRLIASGGSVLIIEHNLDVIRAADWVIDRGPEGGDGGGRIVGQGTPEQIAQVAGSYTGQFLKTALDGAAVCGPVKVGPD
jgi:excinuclease ABC subunit A